MSEHAFMYIIDFVQTITETELQSVVLIPPVYYFSRYDKTSMFVFTTASSNFQGRKFWWLRCPLVRHMYREGPCQVSVGFSDYAQSLVNTGLTPNYIEP